MRHLWKILATAFVVGSLPAYGSVKQNYTPEVNPHPQYFLSLKGKVLAPERGPKKLTLVADYETWNEKCNYLVDRFAGAKAPRDRKLQYTFDLTRKKANLKCKGIEPWTSS